jgi:hypothetical protein
MSPPLSVHRPQARRRPAAYRAPRGQKGSHLYVQHFVKDERLERGRGRGGHEATPPARLLLYRQGQEVQAEQGGKEQGREEQEQGEIVYEGEIEERGGER